ncbi:MAG: DUF2917 domain-containing protein [Candidatus Protistobacter heckmanni]|nr:DUF2917 domain-containing protein [Candidatus Protistobacter heckmanni]
MQIDLHPAPLQLEKNQVLQVADGKGHRVVCYTGNLWITQYCDPKDFILGAGETLTLDRSGPAVIFALEPATVLVEAADKVQRPFTQDKPFAVQRKAGLLGRLAAA